MSEIEGLFEGAKIAVLEAGELLKDRAMSLRVRMKGRDDFVTDTDIAVQNLGREKLEALEAGIGFVGEESPQSCSLDGAVWILDPVDGTSNLIHDYRYSCVSLALVASGRTELGLVYNPFSEELFSAVRGRGAFLNGEAIHVTEVENIRLANISFGVAPGDRDNAQNVFKVALEVYKKCHDLRRMGSAALELCYVAAGRQDGYYEFGLKPWDIAAGALIASEAGGVVGTPWGETLNFVGIQSVVAAGSGIWSQLAGIICGNI